MVGVNIAQDVDGRKLLKKYWTPAVKQDGEGRYELNGGLVAHVPGGKPLQLSVFELCAKDKLGNEGCTAVDSNRAGLALTTIPNGDEKSRR